MKQFSYIKCAKSLLKLWEKFFHFDKNKNLEKQIKDYFESDQSKYDFEHINDGD